MPFVGQRFGKLVLTRAVKKDGRGRTYWLCACDCGGMKRVRSDGLASGRITQCQKCTNAQAGERRKKHGLSQHALYDTWKNMHDRCYKENHRSYPYYGARGIHVVERWHSLECFIEDMGNKPDEGDTLDRIDNDGPYAPDNCRWASKLTQANNTNSNRKLTYRGVTRTVAEWGRIKGILDSTIRERLNAGWSDEEALSGGNKRKW